MATAAAEPEEGASAVSVEPGAWATEAFEAAGALMGEDAGGEAAEAEEADYTAGDGQAGGAYSSDSDSDGLPPLDPYWAAKLNVSKIAEPLPPPRMLTQAELERQRERPRGKGRGGSKGSKGAGKFGKDPMGLFMGFPGGKGWKGGKKNGPPRANDIGDFVAWAKDPSAEDGSRRDRSRSPRRKFQEEELESFMSWAKADPSVKEEVVHQGPADGLDGFLAWATNPEPKEPKELQEPLAARSGAGGSASSAGAGVRRRSGGEEAHMAQPVEPLPEASLRAKDEEEDDPSGGTGRGPSREAQELIVPKELEEELRAMDNNAVGSLAAERRKRDRDSDDESDGR